MFTQTPTSEFPNLSYRRTPGSQHPGPGSTSRLRPCQPASQVPPRPAFLSQTRGTSLYLASPRRERFLSPPSAF